MSFVISQDYRNIFILYYIQDTLGFGRIIKQSSKVFSYVVQDQVGLSRIISLFNGHLVLSKKNLPLNLLLMLIILDITSILSLMKDLIFPL